MRQLRYRTTLYTHVYLSSPRSVLLYLSECVLVEVLSSYESLLSSLSSPVPQECALQLLFNLKFTAGVLATPRETQVIITPMTMHDYVEHCFAARMLCG